MNAPRVPVAALSAVALATGATTAQAIRPPMASHNPGISCSEVHENQTARLVGRIDETRYTEYYYGGGRPTYGPKRYATFPLGSVRITAATCKTPTGWRVLNPVVITPSYEGLTRSGKMDGMRTRAWGMAPRKIFPPTRAYPQGSIRVDPFVANQGVVFRGLRTLADVPLPIPYAADALRWIVGKVIPDDRIRTQQITSFRVAIHITTGGAIWLGSASAHNIRTEYGTPEITGVYEWDIRASGG